MCRAAFCYYDVTSRLNNCNPVRMQQLSITLSTLSKLKLEATFLVKYLDSMVVSISDNYTFLDIHCHSTGFRELTFHHTKFAKLVINSFCCCPCFILKAKK